MIYGLLRMWHHMTSPRLQEPHRGGGRKNTVREEEQTYTGGDVVTFQFWRCRTVASRQQVVRWTDENHDDGAGPEKDIGETGGGGEAMTLELCDGHGDSGGG